jgi:hypothetical protein
MRPSRLIDRKHAARPVPHHRALPVPSMRMRAVTVLSSLILAASCLQAQTLSSQPPPGIKGEVLETQNVDSYTYLRLKTSDAEVWAAAPHGSATATPAAMPLAKVAKASGPDARTVAEVVAGKAALNSKTVLVRGQVVKVNLGIMGKNWLHLQDGSGSAADGSNDLLVTTQDRVAVGDVVNARGRVRTDLNLGGGYAYAVLIEDATVRK